MCRVPTVSPRSHPESLLAKFLLCVEIRLYTNKMWFVVMNNIFPIGITIHERFDLKVRSGVGAGGVRGGGRAACRWRW